MPVHWGTYLPIGLSRRHGRLLRDPPLAFAARAAELAPNVRVAVLHPGDALVLGNGHDERALSRPDSPA